MKLNELTAVAGATKEAKRIGRGHGSGQGKTAGKAAACAPALKVARCLWLAASRREVSTTFSLAKS